MTDVNTAVRLAKKALVHRASRSRVRSGLRTQGALSRRHFSIGVYFADGDVNMYQMRQWYAPLRELSETHPVVVMSRAVTGAEALLADGELPVAFLPQVSDVEAFIADQDLKIILYVNQNARNFQMFRYGRRWHVFINHGESDKMYMTTNQYKAYDYSLIAGQAARERLGRVLWDYDLDAKTFEIGRPQADHYSGVAPYTPDGRTVVLYAPTWEGDRPSALYGSIATHGERLVQAVLASKTHRLIYRPHPRSGVVDREYAAANQRIVQAIAAANASDVHAQHVFDDGPELGWQLAAADIAVVDISAMVYDRLAAGKALFVTKPADPRASVDTSGYLSDCEWLTADAAGDILTQTQRVLHDPAATARLGLWSRRYFGDTTPGAATERFHAAIDELIARWDHWHEQEIGEVPDDAESDPEEVAEDELS